MTRSRTLFTGPWAGRALQDDTYAPRLPGQAVCEGPIALGAAFSRDRS